MIIITITLFVIMALFVFVIYYFCTPRLAAFMYHRFGPEENSFVVSPQMFGAQLKYLKSKSYKSVSLSEVEEHILNKARLSAKSVILTFDDGWMDNYTVAYPLLKKYGVKANIFLTAGAVGQPNMLGWEQIKEMQASGLVSFGSHGMSHARLRELDDAAVLKEMTDSKRLLEENIGVECKSFCYPYGSTDGRIRRLCKSAGYVVDYGTRRGTNLLTRFKNCAALKRAHVMRGETLKDFKWQLLFGHKFF